MSKTALIIGDSPIVKKVEYELPYILNKYFSLGINRIVRQYQTSKHIFLDVVMAHMTNEYPSIPAITLSKYDNIVNKEKELINTFSNEFDFYGKFVDFRCVNENQELAWCGFTHDYAISYLVSKGYENIVLIGAADFVKGGHYINNNIAFISSDKLQRQSKQFIECVHNNYATIYTINENTPLDINYISVDDLMNQTLDKALNT